MNKGVAHILMDKLTGLPFIQRFGGLVTVVSKTTNKYEEGVKVQIVERYPATTDYIISDAECQTNGLVDMVPNSSLTGVLYFEDKGVRTQGRHRKLHRYESKLRLVVWLNTDKLMNETDDTVLQPTEVSTILSAKILSLFDEMESKNVGNYITVSVKMDNILSQDASIFSQYTYNQERTQYLIPPFEYFAVDLTVKYAINVDCLDDIIASLNQFECLPQSPAAPIHYPKLDDIMPYKVTLVVGIDTNTGAIITPIEDKLKLDEVVLVSDVFIGAADGSGMAYQNVPLVNDDTSWDFTNTAGVVEAGIITVIVRKKIT